MRSHSKLHCYIVVLVSIIILRLARTLVVKAFKDKHNSQAFLSGTLDIVPPNRKMSSIGEAVKKERRVTHLLWKAINSQLELEEATKKLMKDMHEDLENMRASGCSSEDWTTMCEMAQQLVDTLKMLKDQGESDSTVEGKSIELEIKEAIREDVEENIEEDMEDYIEVLMREMHPNLDQIKAAAGLEEDDLHDVFGLAKQMAKPHKFALGEKEEEAIIEKENRSNAKKKGKNKKRASRTAPKH
ncbi:hypothetical protein OCU04_011578 [Sclerotinia nivalis]|uniref:Uncharacterized protein n=1 Tax=Sclerotinia nivalis TaxID=352851 RepID=A0A9X0AC09_9HELO|nr:hypothetical protein OCU04_011578 [Sclerotinia nivalis]